jgi:hypothetical protein
MDLSNLSKEYLEAHACFRSVDKVPSDPEMTEFKRRARLKQALWREQMGFPIGSHPMRPQEGKTSTPLGSRLDLDAARKSGANFLNVDIRKVVDDRLANSESSQTLNKDRLICDLLSSMPMCFNLFGSLKADPDAADRAVHVWWPDVPGRVVDVLFEWSPGRQIPGLYLENRSAFDVAFKLELDGGGFAILGVETKYHEDCKREQIPSDARRERYAKVTARSGALSTETLETILGTDLQQLWLDHLLALSMLQHPSGVWKWAGFVLVHPARNTSYARAGERYRQLLNDDKTFQVSTIESLLDADVLPKALQRDFAERYLW